MDIVFDNGGVQYQYENPVAYSPIQATQYCFHLNYSAELIHNFSSQCLSMHFGRILKSNKVKSPCSIKPKSGTKSQIS